MSEPIPTIDLIPGDEYRRKTYGVLMVSATQHNFAGRGIHNRHHRHSLNVWENRRRDEAGQLRDPLDHPTDEPYSYLWSPHASVISAHRSMRETPEMGPTLHLGDVVRLAVNGMVLGEFRIEATPLHDPHLVRL